MPQSSSSHQQLGRMRRAFDGQKRRPQYDRDVIPQMAQTMKRRQIIEKTGISEGYLAQILSAKGARAKPEAALKVGPLPSCVFPELRPSVSRQGQT